MTNSIVKKATDCAYCYVCLQDDGVNCSHHVDGKDYDGPYLYQPSKWVQEVVGRKYRCRLLFDEIIFLCTGYDPNAGFWMQEVGKPEHIRNISERAIDRTYHSVREW